MKNSRYDSGNFSQNAYTKEQDEPEALQNAASGEAHPQIRNVKEAQEWFEKHVLLSGKPYTLDLDQARAVFDQHKNTLVTARAGSGKTRVIVAKVAYLVAVMGVELPEIAVFMFNRTAAAEVNERIADVLVDGRPLSHYSTRSAKVDSIAVASTFHKFALDLVKLSGMNPQIISEAEHERLVRQCLSDAIRESHAKVSPRERAELLKLISGFIARAGQKYTGPAGLHRLLDDVEGYCSAHIHDPSFRTSLRTHQFAFATYRKYLSELHSPKINFNILMSLASDLLFHAKEMSRSQSGKILEKVSQLKYLLVDEYQDFSYLFFNIIQSIRHVAPDAKLFAVGDDWQAINRFAGSDVDYFINFAKYFPEDTVNIPLMTNYRSDVRIVENANDYMLAHYDPQASRAVPFSRQKGKIFRLNPEKVRFNTGDLKEDALGDARYQLAIARAIAQENHPVSLSELSRNKSLLYAAKLLKSVTKIIKKHRHEQIMLLHRHNFTSALGVTLLVFMSALRTTLADEGELSAQEFERQIRCFTMHRSKGLESDVVILLELNRDLVLASHPHAQMFEIFGDNAAAEKSDQHRLLYVALTRAKHQLYILSSDRHPPA